MYLNCINAMEEKYAQFCFGLSQGSSPRLKINKLHRHSKLQNESNASPTCQPAIWGHTVWKWKL